MSKTPKIPYSFGDNRRAKITPIKNWAKYDKNLSNVVQATPFKNEDFKDILRS